MSLPGSYTSVDCAITPIFTIKQLCIIIVVLHMETYMWSLRELKSELNI